jgi:hypothetical protein
MLIIRFGQSSVKRLVTPKYLFQGFLNLSLYFDKVSDIRNIVIDEGLDDEDDEESSPNEDDHHSFVFDYSSSNVILQLLHPLPSQLPFYLQIFKDRVDPLVKMLHVPTIEEIFKEVQDNSAAMSPSREALMFSLYFSVITRSVESSPLTLRKH